MWGVDQSKLADHNHAIIMSRCGASVHDSSSVLLADESSAINNLNKDEEHSLSEVQKDRLVDAGRRLGASFIVFLHGILRVVTRRSLDNERCV